MANIKIQNLLEKEDEEGTRLNIKPDTSKGIRISTIMDDSEIDESTDPADEVAVTKVPEIDETPEQYYLRTGEAPAGYRYVPSAPISNNPEDNVKLERIDAPTPAAEQTDRLFGYERTAKMTEALYGQDLKIIQNEEFIKNNIPKPLQGFARGVTSIGDEALKAIVVAAEAVGETAADAGEAITQAVHDTFTEDNKILGMTGKQILPFDPKTAGRKFAGDLSQILEMAEAVPAVGSATGIAGAASRKAALKPLKEAKESADTIARMERKKLRIQRARGATADEIAEREARAAEKAAANRDISNELITQFEERTGKTISNTVDGNKVLDGELARRAGVETAEEVTQMQQVSAVREFIAGSDAAQTEAALLAGMGDNITQPLLKPEKLNALVATVADLKAKYPDAFDNDKTVIDNLLDLTVEKQLIAGDELIDMLNKYNISFEDYILTVVGSGSEAGKTLQKLSQIKRMRPTNEMIAMQEAATKEAAGTIRKTVMRIENIRRGGLVSQLATAARNLQSGGIRAPLEGFGNVMDNALYKLSEEGAFAGARELGSFSNWKDSFRHMKYMFGPETRLDVKDYVDFILEQPELAGQADLLFNNINEIQKLTGRGEGGVIDGTLSVLEDAVDVLNTPNRWQEHLIRRGAFLGELERLTKREYGIDLIDTINKGQIRDLLNDAGTVKPKDARSFVEIMEEATNKALDITYAKQPDVPVFRSTSQFIVRNGLTVVLPFPRFMFNSMELMGQYAAGASIPLAKKVASVVTRGKVPAKLTMKDRQRISRNLVGSGTLPFVIMSDDDDEAQEGGALDTAIDYAGDMLLSMSVVGAAYQYRTSEEAPADYKLLKTGDNTVMDTTPQFPMRQFMYLGEATRRLKEGTFSDFFDAKEFAETFIGTNIRQGTGQSLIQEVANLATGTDLTDSEQAGRMLGRSLGNYLATWAVPLSQIIEAERATGIRGLQYKDTSGTFNEETGKIEDDPSLDFSTTFMNELSRPFRRLEPAEIEAARPKREFLFAEEKSRVAPFLRVVGGINLATMDDEYGEYIGQFGFTDYELGSRSKVGSIRRFENTVVRDALPDIVENARLYEDRLRDAYKNENKTVKEEFTEDKYVSSKIRGFIKGKIKSVRRQISDDKALSANAPEYAEAMLQYRRLPKETRNAASVRFAQQYDRMPDGTDFKDLMRLVEIAKAYKSVFNK